MKVSWRVVVAILIVVLVLAAAFFISQWRWQNPDRFPAQEKQTPEEMADPRNPGSNVPPPVLYQDPAANVEQELEAPAETP